MRPRGCTWFIGDDWRKQKSRSRESGTTVEEESVEGASAELVNAVGS